MDHILQCHKITKTDFVRGQGCYLYDIRGKQYIDLESGIWAAALGHCHPRVNQVMEAQIKKVMHLGTYYPSPLAESAAMDVLDIVGIDDGKCVLLSSGSEAVEFGVQAAGASQANVYCLPLRLPILQLMARQAERAPKNGICSIGTPARMIA